MGLLSAGNGLFPDTGSGYTGCVHAENLPINTLCWPLSFSVCTA